MTEIAVLGVDLGKNSCSVVALDAAGRVVLRRRLHRDGVVKLAAGSPGCVVAMEACCGAHHLGRRLREAGHEVRLMLPEYVRPYVKAQKNDDRDAEAIAEAATRPTMRFVELKSETQLGMQSLHRARDRLVGERTALINQLRAILLERGITVPQGRRKLEVYLETLLAEEGVPLSPRTRLLVEDQRAEWRELDRRIETFDEEFAAEARSDEATRPTCEWSRCSPRSGGPACRRAPLSGRSQPARRGWCGHWEGMEHGSPSSPHSALQAVEAVAVVCNGQADRIPTMFRDLTIKQGPPTPSGHRLIVKPIRFASVTATDRRARKPTDSGPTGCPAKHQSIQVLRK